MAKKFRKEPILSDSYKVPRYKYSEKDEEYYDKLDNYGMKKSDYIPVYRTKTNTIEVPSKDTSTRDVHLVIKDADGHEILKNGWYSRSTVDQIHRSLPHWGFKVLQYHAGDPNEWLVEKETDDYIEVKTHSVSSSSDLFGIDDTFFTKEEMMELADAVEQDVNDKFKSFNSDFSIQYTGVWIEDDNRTITIEYTCFPNETEYSTSIRVDMRHIKNPGDLFKYVEKFATQIDKEIQSNEVVGSSEIEAGDYVRNLLPYRDIESSTQISAGSRLDDLESVAHDVFNDVMGDRPRGSAIPREDIVNAIKTFDSNMSDSDVDRTVEMVYETIDSYFNRGPFGELEAQKYGNQISKAYKGRTISKRRDEANEPDGLTTCANALGLGTFQLLRALEGMCADGRAYESSDSTYTVR